MKNDNAKLLKEFTEYCKKHPDERFWQALCNFCEATKILMEQSYVDNIEDTWYWNNKNSV